MDRRICVIGFFIAMLTMLVSACSKPTQEPLDRLVSPTVDLRVESLAAQTETLVPTSTEITVSAEAPTDNALPISSPVATNDPFSLSQENITELSMLKRLGGPPAGKLLNITWSADAHWLLVSGQDKLMVYDAATLTMHSIGPIHTMATFIGEGDEYALLDGDRLEVHRTADGSMVRELTIKDLRGDRFLISPKGAYLAAQSLPNQITIWELEEGNLVITIDLSANLEMDVEFITNLGFSQDGSFLYAASIAGGVYQISIPGAAVSRLFQAAFVPDPSIISNTPDECFTPVANGYSMVVLCAHYFASADGSTIASTRYSLKWIDLNGGEPTRTNFETKNSYQRFSLSPDGSYLYVQGIGEFGLLQNQQDEIRTTDAPMCLKHSSDPFFIGPSSSNQVAVIDGYQTGAFFTCDAITGEQIVSKTFEPVTSVAVGMANDSYLIASGSCTGVIELWDPLGERISNSFQAHDGCIHAVDFSFDGFYLASGGEDGRVALWDLRSDASEPVFVYSHPDPVLDLVLNDDGTQIASISKQLVQLYDRPSGKRLFDRQLETGRSITFGEDQWMAYADRDYVYWDQFRELTTDHSPESGSLLFGPGSSYLASSYPRGDRVWFFDVDHGDQLAILDVSAMNILSIALSPNGCLLLGIPEHREFRFWKTAPLEFMGTVDTGIKYENRLVDAELSPDGHLLVAGSLDGSILIWGLAGALEAPPGSVAPSAICDRMKVPSATTTATATGTKAPTAIRHTATLVPFSRNLYLTTPRFEGPDVLALQQRLLALGYSQVGVADGVFGPLTDQAVRLYQQEHGLVVDGIVGPKTWGLLFGIGE